VAFTTSLTSDIGKVRRNLDDRSETSRAFNDDEIQSAIDEGGTVNAATAICIRILLASRVRRAAIYATPENGQSVVDDATAIAGLRNLLDVYGGGAAALPAAVVGDFGPHPSDPTQTLTRRL
jgi:hypothetical protein